MQNRFLYLTPVRSHLVDSNALLLYTCLTRGPRSNSFMGKYNYHESINRKKDHPLGSYCAGHPEYRLPVRPGIHIAGGHHDRALDHIPVVGIIGIMVVERVFGTQAV
jgi:hypothetical protein